MLRYLLVGFVLGSILLGCSGGNGGGDGGTGGGGGTPPELTSISPTHGPLGGSTLVTVNGGNFDDGATVKFGDRVGLQVIVASKQKLTVRTPKGAALGKVSVTVSNLNGQSVTGPNLFTYDPDSLKEIDEALIENPLDVADLSGNAMVTVTILSQVSAGLLTKGMGQGAGIKAQVGVATALSSPPVVGDFTWSDATFAGDADGPTPGDLLRDAYKADVLVAGVTGMQTKEYRLAARFSTDNGATWVLADRDGIANGFTEPQLPKVRLSRPSVDWCKLGGEIVESPPQVKVKVGAAGPTIYGQVYKLAVTNAAGAGPGIKGQLGYGAPTADPTTWTWIDATYNKDTSSGANDEFQAAIPATLAPGTYAFAYRFNVGDGPQLYCDEDGTGTGNFTIDQAGTLEVTPIGVDRCKLQFPASLDARPGAPSPSVYGRVLATTITEAAGAGAGITGEVGYGPTNKTPDDASWAWSAASYNLDAADGTEEWGGKLTFAAVGTYSYGFRFKYQSSGYTYCDLDGSENGVAQAQLGAATVKVVDVDDCQLDAPGTFLAQPSGTTAPSNAHVWVTSVTDAAGQGAGVTGEVGYGPVGTMPSTWTNWQSAAYASDAIFFDLYNKALTAPAGVGTYDVAWRFKYQSQPYVYCDLDGAANGYQPAQAGKLTVANATISACNLQYVDKPSVPSGDVVTGYVRVTVPGLSAAAGATPGLRAQLGVGPAGDNASGSALWGWKEAAFNVDTGGADEFLLAFQPAYNGNRAVSARASLDNGASWTYCDLNGSDVGGYEVGQQFAMTVTDHQDFEFCNLQFPAAITTLQDAGAVTVYGQLYVAGGTPNPGLPVTVQVGVGKKVEDPGLAWTWGSAQFGSNPAGQPNNNEYTAGLYKPIGTYHYAFRYSRDGGSWCFGDLNGNGKNGGSNVWAGFYGDAPDGGLNLGLLTVQ